MPFLSLTQESAYPDGSVADSGDGTRIAPMSRRFGAYLIDVLMVTAIVAFFALAGHPLPTGVLNWQGALASMLVFTCYATISQVLTHNTLGKYLLGIQVVNDHAEHGIPSLGRIVLRETIGRILSLQIFMGYLMAFRHDNRQAWSDQMADTVVVMRKANPALRLALIAGAVVFFLGAWMSAGYVASVKQRNIQALARQIAAGAPALDQLGRSIDRLHQQGKTLAEIQANHRQMLPLLDELDQRIHQAQGQVVELQQKSASAPLQRNLYVFNMLLDQSALMRKEAMLILSYEPGTALAKIRGDLAPLNAQMVRLNQRLAAQIAANAADLARKKKGP